MSGRNGTGDIPVWLWVVGAIVFFQVMDDLWGLIPLVIMGFVLWQILGNRGRQVGRPSQGRPLPPPGPAGEPTHLPRPQGAADPVTGQSPYPSVGGPPPPTQMPRIDVPTYPGTPASGPGHPTIPSATPSTTPSGDDPAVSLARLQLAQAGRDLRAARQAGDDARVRHVLGQVGQAAERVQGALGASAQQHSAGARHLRGELSRMQGHIGAATRAGSGADGALLDRIATAAVTMGQTGPHE